MQHFTSKQVLRKKGPDVSHDFSWSYLETKTNATTAWATTTGTKSGAKRRKSTATSSITSNTKATKRRLTSTTSKLRLTRCGCGPERVGHGVEGFCRRHHFFLSHTFPLPHSSPPPRSTRFSFLRLFTTQELPDNQIIINKEGRVPGGGDRGYGAWNR